MDKQELSTQAIKSIAGRILKKPETATDGETRAMAKYLLGIPVLKSDIN